jgi:hypothetical protein
MSIQLKLNNSGSWKTILHDIDEHDLDDVRECVLSLMAFDRTHNGRWKLDRESFEHPCGELLWVARVVGGRPEWVQR